MIKNLVLLIILSTTFMSYGQIIREQIGTSVVLKNHTIIGDSMLTNKIEYDRKSRIMKEWRISRNDSGRITDTNWCNFDTMRNITYFYGGRNSHSYHYFDNSGNEIGWKIISPEYNGQMFYKSEYNVEGKIIHQLGSSMQGVFSGTDEIKYNYIKDTVIERHGDNTIVIKTVKNRFNRITYSERMTQEDSIRIKDGYIQEFDKNGYLLKYTRIENDIITKITIHKFKDDVEQYMIEEFLDKDYKIITNFKYHYW